MTLQMWLVIVSISAIVALVVIFVGDWKNSWKPLGRGIIAQLLTMFVLAALTSCALGTAELLRS